VCTLAKTTDDLAGTCTGKILLHLTLCGLFGLNGLYGSCEMRAEAVKTVYAPCYQH
jgi:hypothetical protein